MTSTGSWRTVLCLAACMAGSMAVVSAQSVPDFSVLTVPPGSLPDGCRLTPPPSPESPAPAPIVAVLPGGGVIRRAPRPFAVPPFLTNPWFGTDYKYIAMVRSSFDSALHLPDGPPLERADAARLRAKLAGHITEAYRALYASPSGERIEVEAVRYADSKWATPDPPMRRVTAAHGDSTASLRIVRGATVVLITGDPQRPCFKALRNHIQSLK
jgi:hypothetical protein